MTVTDTFSSMATNILQYSCSPSVRFTVKGRSVDRLRDILELCETDLQKFVFLNETPEQRGVPRVFPAPYTRIHIPHTVINEWLGLKPDEPNWRWGNVASAFFDTGWYGHTGPDWQRSGWTHVSDSGRTQVSEHLEYQLQCLKVIAIRLQSFGISSYIQSSD